MVILTYTQLRSTESSSGCLTRTSAWIFRGDLQHDLCTMTIYMTSIDICVYSIIFRLKNICCVCMKPSSQLIAKPYPSYWKFMDIVFLNLNQALVQIPQIPGRLSRNCLNGLTSLNIWDPPSFEAIRVGNLVNLGLLTWVPKSTFICDM